MKKLMAAFLAGALFIGIGAGITVLEISRWDVVHHPYYLDTEKLETLSVEEQINPVDFDSVRCYVSQTYRDDVNSYEIIDIIEDKTCTDTIKVEVDYRGERPHTDFWTYENQDENDVKTYIMDYYVQPGYNMSMRAVRNMLDQMFEDKIFYTGNAASIIEQVRIYTATPEKLQKIH